MKLALASLVVMHLLSVPSSGAQEHTGDLVVRWIECDGCKEESLLLRYFGKGEVSQLREFVVAGPPELLYKEERSHLEEAYEAMKAYNSRFPGARTLAMSKREYVRYYLHGFDDHYRLRAIKALRALDPAKAVAAIEEALKQASLRDELRRRLEEVRREME